MSISFDLCSAVQQQRAALPDDAGDILLPLARAAIAAQLSIPFEVHDEAAWLHVPGATFVTLKQQGELRGCIGTLAAHRPLAEDVRANAAGAAFRDPRFPPIQRPEFESISVEVSVLSVVEVLDCRDEADALARLRPGIDGVIFEYGHHRSTFLPQVWEQFSDPLLFLSHLRRKAGLPPNFWDPAVKFSRYTVSKWQEVTGT